MIKLHSTIQVIYINPRTWYVVLYVLAELTAPENEPEFEKMN